jgi:hypothetical protein
LQHEIETGFQEAKDHGERLDEQIRLIAHQMATKADLQGTKADLRELLRREIREIGDGVRVIAEQVAVLSARKRKKQ